MRARRTTAFVLVGLLCGLAVGVPWGLGGASGGPALAAEVRNPDGVAVIIGNKSYSEGPGEVAFAHRDAEAFRRYVIDVLGYDPRYVRVLNDASFGDMRLELGTPGHPGRLHSFVERRRLLSDDGAAVSDVVVFYSGHGMPSLNLEEPGSYGQTPLMIAAVANATAAVSELTARSANIEAPKGTDPLLHLAARYNAVDVIAQLVAHGADVNERSHGELWMPLHAAAHFNAADAVTELLAHGADINAPSTMKEGFIGRSPLTVAAGNGAYEAAKALIAGGAQPDSNSVRGAASRDDLELVTLLIERDADLGHALGYGGESVLHRVSKPRMISLLTSHGADVNAKARNGETPLHQAVELMLEFGLEVFSETVAALLDHGADVIARDNNGEAPLHIAARWGSREMLVILIEAGADIRAKTNAGATIVDLWETEK